jgi:tetratricopeptide (TPR) repeat protein
MGRSESRVLLHPGAIQLTFSTRRRLSSLLLLLLAWPLMAVTDGADPEALLPIPWPDDNAMESAIQEQIRQARAVLEPIIANTELPVAELADAYGSTGQIYLVYSLVDSAQACLYNAAILAPEEFRWNYYLGRTYHEDGKPAPAAVFLGKAHHLDPADLPTLIRLAQAELGQNHLERAADHFQQILVLDPGNAAAHFGLGQIAAKQGDQRQAVLDFETTLASQPQATSVHYQLALAYRDLGETELARAHLAQRGAQNVQFQEPLMQELRSLVRGGSLLVYSATHARAAGELDAAIQGFQQALKSDPNNNATRLNLASTLIQKGDLAAARQVLEEALRYDESNSSAHYNLGLILDQAGQRDLALRHLQRATEVAPDFVDAHLNYGLLLQESGRLPEAEQQYSMAAQLDPTDAELRFRHASVLLQLHRLPQAIDELELALDVQPDSVDGHLLMARAQGISGAFSASADSFGQVLELDPSNQEALFARALALLLSDRYREAQDHLQTSLRLQPRNLALKHTLARLLATCPEDSIRDGDRALQLAEEVINTELTVDHAQTMAMALAAVGRYEEAASLQMQIIDQASRLRDPQLNTRLRRNLDLYRAQQPVLAPWRQGS